MNDEIDKMPIPIRTPLSRGSPQPSRLIEDRSVVRQTPENMFTLDEQNHSVLRPWAEYSSVVLVILGMCLRFGGEQFLNNKPLVPTWTKHVTKYTGVMLYIGGWFVAATSLSFKYSILHKNKKNLFKHCIFSMILVSIIWFVFEFNGNSDIVQPNLPLVSCSMLISLLLVLALEHNSKDILKTVIASCLIVLSEYIVLPFQRNNDINDGLGLPLLFLGWIVLFRTFDRKTTQHIPLVSRTYL
jgi:hypothetical protein